MSRKKQGFVYGALILMLSGIVVKAVGALFKIPLSNIIGDTAMGYFNTAYSIYSMCFLISTAGLPVAISRMIARSRAMGRGKEVDVIYRISLLIFAAIGLLGSAILFFFADAIALLPDEPELALCIQSISPIMFFICLVSCIRGYFQGNQNMTPTAVSQIIEVMGKLLLGLAAGIFAVRQGHPPQVVAAFALGGVTFGVVLSALFMSLTKWFAGREEGYFTCDDCREKKDLAGELISIAIPITISSSILSLTSVIDSMVAVRRLNDACVGISYFAVSEAVPVAVTLCGAYMAKAVTLFNLTPTVIYPFAISIIPTISSAEAKKDNDSLKKTMDFTFLIVSVICLPAAFGLGMMAKPIVDLLFTTNEPIFLGAGGEAYYSNSVVAPMLTVLASAIVFSGLISVSGAVLQASGHENKSIISTCLGVAAKAVTTWILVGDPRIGHLGIPVSTLICYLTMFVCNLFFLSKYVSYRISFGRILIKPLLCALLCGVTALFSFSLLSRFLSPSLSTVFSILLGAAVYGIVLFKSRSVGKEEILMLPKGEKILSLLTALHLLKA